MTPFDYAIVGLYLVVTLAWGARHARRAGQSVEQFFVAGRSLPWWLAGTSIVATTFAADTPLAIAGLVVTEGIAGNWFWWADVLPAMIAALLIAALWRRSGVITDNEIIELRYGGRAAAGLRGFRAIYFGVIRNAIVIGWVNLAMLKVLELTLGLEPGQAPWVLTGLFVLTVSYTLLSGLWGVVVTDVIQFSVAMIGSVVLAALAVESAGGLAALLGELQARIGPEAAGATLALVPHESEAFWAFVIYVGIKSWSTGNTEGGGYVAQRLFATRDEQSARLAAIWYAVAHFALRPWPWILVGLVAFVSYPSLEDPESGYVRVLLDTMPIGLRGAMIAAMLAAFMSTVDTQLNWGASYLTHDLFRRFLAPGASERTLVRVARASVVGLAAIGALTTLLMPSISGAWKFLAHISAGAGLIALLRWFWWRMNAWGEIAVMVVSLVAANAVMLLTEIPFPFSLAVTVGISVPVALAVMWLSPPEPVERLRAFYRKVRPPGAWGPVAEPLGLQHERLGVRAWMLVGAATFGVYALLLGIGGLVLGSPLAGTAGLCLGIGLLAIALRQPAARGEAGDGSGP